MEDIPVSPYSKIFINEYDGHPDACNYNVVALQRITGRLDIARLEHALNRLVQDHLLLNSHIHESDGQLYWRRNAEIYPLQCYPDSGRLTQITSQPFDIYHGPLYRWALFDQGSAGHDLALIGHHLVIDGASSGEFFSLISQYYHQQNVPAPVSAQEIATINLQLQQDVDRLVAEGARAYWQAEASRVVDEDEMAVPFLEKNPGSGEAGEVRFSLNKAEWKRWKQAAGIPRINDFLALLVLWGVLMARCGNRDSVAISYPVAIKKGRGFAFGAHVNTSIIPITIRDDADFTACYRQALSFVMACAPGSRKRYNQLPTQDIVQSCGIRTLPISFAQTDMRNRSLAIADCDVSPRYDAHNDMANALLSLEYEDSADADALQFRLRFCKGMFDPQCMENCADYFIRLLHAAMTHPHEPLSTISFFPPAIENGAKHIGHPAAADPVEMNTLSERFELIAQRFPEHIALEFEGVSVSYNTLNCMANALAREIVLHYESVTGSAPGADSPIALYSEKSIEMIVALLAILKTGAAYVPISCHYPPARIQYILEDTQAALILTRQETRTLVAPLAAAMPHAVAVLTLDGLADLPQDRQNLAPLAQEKRLGAVIYTSGSTGNPKGVMIEQHAMRRLAVADYIDIGTEDVFLFLSSPAFDAATFEIWGALLNGARLVIVRDTQDIAADLPQLAALMTRQKISILWVTRSLFDYLYLSNADLFSGLRYLLVGGEALTAPIMQRLMQQPNRPQHVLNGYGPTECTTFTTLYPIQAIEYPGGIPIGRAIAGRELYVLDNRRQPLPPGAAGELYIGGSALARGYLNLPEQTQNSFIERDGRRLYRTGDRVRWLQDGNLEYLGRNDCQVKIRGFRIELSEIENVINALEPVRKSVVLDVTHRERKRLAAYLLLEKGAVLSSAGLRAALESRLPDYMVPASYVAIDEIPLTVNGKLDPKALPAPQFAQNDAYVAPQNVLEQQICTLWSDILGVDQVGIHDDFFRLGGDSIQSIVFTSELSKLGHRCNSRAVFEARTAEALARRILHAQSAVPTLSEQGALSGQFDLLPIQRWFNEQRLNNAGFFNQTFLVRVPPMPAAKVAALVEGLAKQHDMLRARFTVRGESIVSQHYLTEEAGCPAWGYYDLASCRQSRTELLHQWQSGFDLVEGPLCRFVYIYDSSAPGYALMFCAFHHLIVDVVSWRIIIRDMQQLYQEQALPAKGTSYRQWGERLKAYAETHSAQRRYWLEMVAGQPDYGQHETRGESPACYRLVCDAALTARLQLDCQQAYNAAINDVLLAALAPVLQAWHGAADSYLSLEQHGRDINDDAIDLDGTVGWFTALVPLRITAFDSQQTTLRTVKERLRSMPDHGVGYAALKYYASAMADPFDDDLRHHALPKISFNYLGSFGDQADEPLWALIDQAADLENGAMPASSNVLDLTLYISDGRLHMVLSGRLPLEELQQLGARYEASLAALADHGSQLVRQGITCSSPSDFPHADIGMAELDSWQRRQRISAIFEATVTQRELMYFNRLNREYQIDQAVYEISGRLQPEILNRAWALSLQRFEMLRAGFSDDTHPGRPNVFICEDLPASIAFEDWCDIPAHLVAEHREALLRRERATPFELNAPPLIRWTLVKIGEDKHYLIQTFNHILFDGWSLGVLFEQWFNDYMALLAGQSPQVVANRFEPYAAHMRRYGDDPEAQRFWHEYLQGAPVNQRLPFTAAPGLGDGRRMRQHSAAFSAPQLAQLTAFCRRQGKTVNQVTQLAWMLALGAVLGSDDVVIGTTMSERPSEIEHIQTLFGLCVASPVLRVKNMAQRPVNALLDEIAASQILRQKYAFSELNHYDENWVPTSPFGSLFVFENMPKPAIDPRLPFEFRVVDIVSGSNHQTVLCLFPDAEQIAISLFYNAEEIGPEAIGELCRRFIATAVAIANMPPDSDIVAGEGLTHHEGA